MSVGGGGGTLTAPGHVAGMEGSSGNNGGDDAGASHSCTPAWRWCDRREECCSGMCVNHNCFSCRTAGERCRANGECCSEICDPETGSCLCHGRGGSHAICRTDADCCTGVCDPELSMCAL